MNSPLHPARTTLLTAHKGVDLHAASALLVMQDRLEGGDQLRGLFRCEVHSFLGRPDGWDGPRLLDTGRFYNPNKHHYGLFRSPGDRPDWLVEAAAGGRLPSGWPGRREESDLPGTDAAGLYDTLLGGPAPAGGGVCDVLGFARGQTGPVASGVLWRLQLKCAGAEAEAVGENLAVARHRKQGLLVNPHMECWFVVGP